MSKRVFISYSHQQGQWVCERLVPILRAAGCADVLLDRERFRAGRGLKGQMDATQDQADVSLLVLTPDYLASDYCQHEMQRALASDPEFKRDRVLPLQRADCDLSAFQRASDPPPGCAPVGRRRTALSQKDGDERPSNRENGVPIPLGSRFLKTLPFVSEC